MNQYYEKDGKIYFKFNYDSRIVTEVRKIDGRWYNPDTKEWSVPISIINQADVKNFIKNFNFQPISNTDNINTYLSEENALDKIKTYRELIQTLNLKYTLRDYQYRGVDLMNHFYDCINGDDMGLGKTLQTIYSVETMNDFPCLVVCPSSVKYHWKKYWSESNPNRKVTVIDATNKENDFDAEVVIINYDYVSKSEKIEKGDEEVKVVKLRFHELNQRWGTLVCDEIHYVKNSKANRSKAIRQIAKNSGRKIGLTGTIVQNRPSEIINPLMVIGKFNSNFRNWKFFVERYCDAKMTRFGLDISGSKNTLELNKILKATCYIRREKKEVFAELPDRQDTIENVQIDNFKQYVNAEDDFLDYVTKNFSTMKAEKALMAEFLVQRNTLRQLSVKGKLKGLIEWLENYQESTEEKLLVFGVHREVLTKLAIHFDCDIIDGSIGSWEKSLAIEKFKTSKNQFIFGNIKAMGTGTDGLQHAASNVAFIELPDNPAQLDQAISRVERIGVKNNINIWYLLSEDTIDLPMWNAIEQKRTITEAINKGIEVTPISFDDILIESIKKKRGIE